MEVRALATAGRSFCSKRRRGCSRPGERVRIDLSRAAAVTGVLRRRPLRGSGRARRRLTSGRYTLTVRVDGRVAGTLSFKLR